MTHGHSEKSFRSRISDTLSELNDIINASVRETAFCPPVPNH